MNFNSGHFTQSGVPDAGRTSGFPTKAFVGDLWFDVDSRSLLIAVYPADASLPSQSGHQRDISSLLYNPRYGLTVKRGPRARVPSSATAGSIFLTTDTLQAFAGTGFGVVDFRLDVTRALANGDPSQTF